MNQTQFSILLVDDNPVNREIWSMYLSNEGYGVESVSTGMAALQIVADELVDLVVLDVLLPDLDGFEVLRRLRERYAPEQLPVIMATAKGHSEDIVRGFDLGANDYVTKPVHLDVLVMRIAAQLRSKTPAAATSGHGASLLTPATDLPAGTVLEGKYRLEDLIGQGSCGAVYRATHLILHRPVAVKLLTAAASSEARERLQREGISAWRTQHPNAVEVLDLSVTDTGIPYLVMELLHGHSLDQELKQEGLLPERRAAEILVSACEVLAEAHGLGIVHRDVKPQNVFLHRSRQGEIVKVLDFGIATVIGDVNLGRRLTLEGSLIGTPAYMAPERLRDEPYDGRADVYSLGVMLYEMLTGRRPFVAMDLLELIRLQVHEPPRPPREIISGLSPEVEEVTLAALAKDPGERLTAAELGRRLAAAANLDRPPAEPEGEAGVSGDGPMAGDEPATGGETEGGGRTEPVPVSSSSASSQRS